jgi:putative glycosyl hydrolase protein
MGRSRRTMFFSQRMYSATFAGIRTTPESGRRSSVSAQCSTTSRRCFILPVFRSAFRITAIRSRTRTRSSASHWRARERTGLDPIRFRPWLQSFANYPFDKRQFGAAEIQVQIRAAESFGSDGWLLWNSRNNYSAENIKPKKHEAVSATTSAKQPGVSATLR